MTVKKLKTFLIHKKTSKCFEQLQKFVILMADASLSKFETTTHSIQKLGL